MFTTRPALHRDPAFQSYSLAKWLFWRKAGTAVGAVGQGPQQRELVALEAIDQALPRRAMPAHVGGALQPARDLRVEQQTAPPAARSSDCTTARIWSNSNSSGTPPKVSKALSSASISAAIVCRREQLSHSRWE